MPAPPPRTRRLHLTLIAAAICALVMVPRAWCASLEVGQPAPSLTWTTAAGDTTTWEELRGDRPLVAVFWATWCGVCKKTWPELASLEAEFAESPLPPVWTSVSLGESADKVLPVVKKRKLPGTALVDPAEANGKKLGIKFVPTVCVIDGSGSVVYVGKAKTGKLKQLLSRLTVPDSTTQEDSR